MKLNYEHQTLALAGIQQALCIVQNIAWHGIYSSTEMKTCITSLFQLNAASFDDVYGNRIHLATGYRALCESLELKNNQRAMERTRYFAGLLMLSRNIKPQSNLSRQLYTTLSMLETAARDYDQQSAYIIEKLAQLYQNTLSKMTPRIIIHGEPVHLQSENNASRIRAMLLCGIRGCVLWRQAGGSQLKLLWGRKKILHCAKQVVE